jgi:hypothetical protein
MAGRIAYYGNIVTNGLVLNLDAAKKDSYPGSGTTWRDISGNGNNGTLTNGPTFDKENAGSIVFDGVDDYVIGNLSSSSNWTMCIWYLSTDITSNEVYYPFGCTTGGNGLGFGGSFSVETQNRWYFFDGVTVHSNLSMSVLINTWYHLIVTKSSTSYNLYTNGLLSLSTSGIDLTCTQFTLGRRGNSFAGYVKGNISIAQIYNRALSSSEVLQNYNSTKARYGL